jgi:hypothetical protein
MRPTMKDVDVISPQLAWDMLTHNEHGASICGWKRNGI